MPKIQFITQDGTKLKFELTVDSATVGRADGNDIVLPDSSVSSRHGEILLKGNDIELVDLGSTNGTYVSGERVDRAKIKPGGKFKLGSVEGLLIGGDVSPKADEKKSSHSPEKEEPQESSSWSGAPTSAAAIIGLGATPCPVRQRKGFGPKVKKKDKVASLFTLIAVISLLVCAVAMWLITMMGA